MRFRGAAAALSAVALLAACTPSDSSPDSTRKDAATEQASPAPVFRIDDVAEPESKEADDQESTEDAESTATPTSTASAAGSGDVVESGAEVDLKSGKRVSLSVDGATLTDISLTDPDHPRMGIDPGVFFDGSGTELDAEDGEATAGGTATPKSESKDTEATAPAAEDAAAEDAEAAVVTAPAESTSWVSEYDLVADSTYELTATATTPDGKEHDFTSTVKVKGTDASAMAVRTVLSDDQTVGVAAPIILTFGSTVAKKYRDDVERRLSVEVTDEDGNEREVEGSWAWLPDDPQSRLHFRPKEYWPAHSKVSVDAPLKDVPTARNRVGENDLTIDFEIGREQIVEASAKTHRMIVTREGKEIMNFPTSLGSPQAPSYNGIHVVMSKHANYTMTSERWDYETPTQWAVRIHNNGEFVHAAPWSTGAQGSRNVSHGCINLSTARAKEYYDTAIYGDPVVIKGSSVDLSTEASDISDWVYEWDEWKELSALD
ncbi:lipoprotein-anchoring transpeptidase ErfK/SrfK [Brevibacterium sanguinis]|uniref:Lipoprotein-anchoring transpeptidase ErfK/SrfK n=2 Tax=Brevibacterium TaxID=1696 RepID=A0A366IHY8_9MICO|nr:MULTISPECIES: Ig-like domain-containing protein [Brevibacterium]RBP63441.1 lipoprotein-anchoring transpeptidase ErfK/SrfK [Brevibacterium sanguinis]RBP69908.1 lipoprotein-anchoring transpeptidase ErfK/SrfK [Brevibacterium celere]